MSRLIVILILLSSANLLLGQQALTGNHSGQWCIYSKGQKILLPHEIHDLGNFDELGLTFFMRHEKYGIINDRGEIILEETYGSIKQLGGGYYLVLEEGRQVLLNWNQNQLQARTITKYVEMQRNWFHVIRDSSSVLVNTSGHKEWEMKVGDAILESDFNYVRCEMDGNYLLFDPQGNEISVGNGYSVFAQNHLLLNCEGVKKVVYRSHEVELPIDAKDIRVMESEICYAQKGQTTIVDALNGNVQSVIPFESTAYYTDNYMFVYKDRNVGLVNKKGVLIIPPNYVNITQDRDCFSVRKASGAGVLDKNGKEIVPCLYNYVVTYRDFITVHDFLGLTGLISRKTERTILPCGYTRLMLSDLKIRAWSGDLLRIVELDSAHRIVNDIVMSNVISLEHTNLTETRGVDERLFPLGWYLGKIPIYDSLGFLVNERTAWGLKGENDSTLIFPKYSEPIYVPQADFSLINEGKPKEIKYNDNNPTSALQLGVISHRTGKRLIPEPVYTIDTMDLLTRSYARFLSGKGNGFLLDDNSILRVDYFDGYDTRFVRFCTSDKKEMLPAKKSDFDALRFPSFNLNDDPSNSVPITIARKSHDFFRLNDAKWNFLDTNGRKVFAEPFDFAEPYNYDVAIVMKEGKWGVVRADSFIVAPRFVSVKRSPISDTLFVVKRAVGGVRFLDTNARMMSNGMSRLQLNKGEISQIEINGFKSVISSDYQVISGETHFQKVLDNDVFYSKEDKEFTVYDKKGRLLGAFKDRPEEIWLEEYALMRSRGKMGLLSMDNDTLIPFMYKEIQLLGKYIFAKDGARNKLYDSDVKLIVDAKSSDVLADPVSGNFALIDESKAIVFSPTKDKIARHAGTDFTHFHNNYLISFGKQLRVFGDDVALTFEFTPESLDVMGENGYLVVDSDKLGHYFSPSWEEIVFDEPLKRAKYVGEGLAIARTSSKTLLFGGEVLEEFDEIWNNKGLFENGFLLLEQKQNAQFVNANGINQFQQFYADAEPFMGKYATVKEKDGWTIINGMGNFQILPSFDEIKPLGTNIFSTTGLPEYGLFDAHGNELIPASYHQLNFLRNGIIQGRKDGVISYFDLSGKPIVLE